MSLSKLAKEHIIVALANEVVGEEVIQAIEESGVAGAVSSVNTMTGDVVLTKSDVGLSNVPNVNATNPANISQTSSYRFVTDIEKAAWSAKQDALGFTAEDSSNKAINLTSPDNIKYPTTQAVATALSGKAESSHNHSLSNLTQSGATSGQVPSWNGTNWVPATPAPASVAWGDITGDIIDQTDLQSALDGKFNNPTGDTTQYIAGDGSLIAFPSFSDASRLVTRVENMTGSLIPKGSLVYINGAHGNRPTIALAQANTESTSSKTFAMTIGDIEIGAIGLVANSGEIGNLDTFAYNEGDALWLSGTVPGGFTVTKPSAPTHLVFVGIVVRKHPTLGAIDVKIQNGYELDELHNVQINGSLANNDTLVYDSVAQLWKNSATGSIVNKLTKGTKTIFCIDNGDFATGQAAVDAASAGDTILFGAKSGGWGDIVIPAGKKLSLRGLQSARSIYVRIGALTFSPTTGTQIVENELYLDGLYFDPATSIVPITFGGTAPARIRISNCYIYANSNNSSIVLSNSNAASSAYLYDNTLTSTATTAFMIDSSCPYIRLYRNTLEGACPLFRLSSGVAESNDTNFNGARAGEIISLTGGTFICGKSLIANSTTNGSGILMATGSVLASSSNTFAVATGTGYCIRGVGTHLYGPYITSNSIALAYNVKIQNTITSIAYGTAFTPTA